MEAVREREKETEREREENEKGSRILEKGERKKGQKSGKTLSVEDKMREKGKES